MARVYVVTCGEYSDYRIKACFSSMELAKAYINEPKIGLEPMYGDACEIEEYELDEEPKIHWYVQASIDVDTREVRTNIACGQPLRSDWLYCSRNYGRPTGLCLSGDFEVESFDAVPKILNDKLSKIMAMHGGVAYDYSYHRDTLEPRKGY